LHELGALVDDLGGAEQRSELFAATHERRHLVSKARGIQHGGLCRELSRLRRLSLGVLLVEPIYAASGVEQLLLAREERVAVRADIDAEVAARRERVVDRAARARDASRAVVGMTCGVLHKAGRCKAFRSPTQ